MNRSLLASMPNQVVVIDGEGRVVAVNQAWTGAARCDDCADARVGVGADYLRHLESEPPGGRQSAGLALSGIRSVVLGEQERFELTYRCERHSRNCCYRLTAEPLEGGAGGAVVVHTDISELEQAKAGLERSLLEIQELKERLEAENICLRKEIGRSRGFEEIVGTSAAITRVLHQVEQVAGTDSPVLILGETGTGKDLIARAIHNSSLRKNEPLITVNCAALPATLIESEMFGYEKGAFTGALARTFGRFEAAHGGSILLDEIGELPVEVQAKLLRALQSGEFERLGSAKTIQVDVRVIAATNRDLEKEVREGRFRADLYYRLSVFPITVPPLRERVEDIPLLAWHFITRNQGRLGKSIERIPNQMMRALRSHPWPGNIRELQNAIERALIVTTGSTLANPLLIDLTAAGREQRTGSRLAEVERAHILEVLGECGWKVAGRGNAAERLGLKRGTLQFRMKKLGIRRPAPDA
jgi:transcriptional regulator with GAF, ATPase, and Fis domain